MFSGSCLWNQRPEPIARNWRKIHWTLKARCKRDVIITAISSFPATAARVGLLCLTGTNRLSYPLVAFFSRARPRLERLMRVFCLSLLVTGLLAAGVAPAQGAPITQSPIDFRTADLVLKAPYEIEFNYPTFPNDTTKPEKERINVLNEGSPHRQTSLKAKFEEVTQKATVKVDDKTYTLDNIHFHKHSEHFLNGGSFHMEMHMVHKSGGDNLAIGALDQRGREQRGPGRNVSCCQLAGVRSVAQARKALRPGRAEADRARADIPI